MTEDYRAKAKEMFETIDIYVREDIGKAADWARDVLTKKEGAGHEFSITAHCEYRGTELVYTGMVQCSFMKPEWAGDHCGEPMESGSEALVMAVCEYLCGL